MRFLLKLFIILFILSCFSLFFAYLYYSKDLPNIDEFIEKSDKNVVQINFSNGEIITKFSDFYYEDVEFYELPQHLIDAVISIEDNKFFSHSGFDISAIIRAFYINQKSKKIVQGASTITQQLAKMLFLTNERTFKRKIQELILAHKIEEKFTKEQILTMYLNKAYFGAGNYGISSACKYYFQKNVSQLNVKEAALLAGLLKAPSKLSPKNDKKLARDRANLVLNKMLENGFIDEKTLKSQKFSYSNNSLQKLYFADFVNVNFKEYLNKNVLNQNLIINTTLNQEIQEMLENELNKFYDKNEKILQKSQIAAIIMNKDGAILAMSGGKNYQESQYNRAIYAKRQAGSVFKIFVYLTAFEKGFKPDDVFEDKKIEFSNWLPNNYEGKYFGKVSLKNAFAKSLNSVAIQLAKEVGLKDIAKNANKLGINSKINDNDLTTALGTAEVSLLELTTSYCSILNDAKPIISYSIAEILDKNQEVIYKRETSGFDAIFSEDTIKYGKEILREVVKNGTAKKLDIRENIYGKTGTSQNYRDAWFVGFDDDFVVGIWIGNDDNSATNKIKGGNLPVELSANIFDKL